MFSFKPIIYIFSFLRPEASGNCIYASLAIAPEVAIMIITRKYSDSNEISKYSLLKTFKLI